MLIEQKGKGEPQPIGSMIPDYLPPIYHDFFSGIIKGQYVRPSYAQRKEAVDGHFSFEPLTPLTSSEEEDLRKDMHRRYRKSFTRPTLLAFADDVYLVGESQLVAGRPGEKYGKPPLTPQEKEILLTDPQFYHRAKITAGIYAETGLRANGTRHLTLDQSEDSYSMSNADFFKILSSVRQFQGKDLYGKLQGLDIGGSTGLGAHDAEKLDFNLQMTNITIHPELGMWPLRGGHTIMLAERMPQEYFEQFDFIISNMAFRYFRFPEVALNNALLALKVGGIMRISFNGERSPLLDEDRMDELIKRISGQFEIMEQLQAEGVIQFLPESGWIHARDKFYNNGDEKSHHHGIVYLQKTKSLK